MHIGKNIEFICGIMTSFQHLQRDTWTGCTGKNNALRPPKARFNMNENKYMLIKVTEDELLYFYFFGCWEYYCQYVK